MEVDLRIICSVNIAVVYICIYLQKHLPDSYLLSIDNKTLNTTTTTFTLYTQHYVICQ